MQFISLFLHSYSGYTPRVKYTYGETFGNTTGRWFQDYRAATLNTSKERMGRGGDKFLPFPTYYTNNPDHVLGKRTSSRDRWLAAPKYKLLNIDDRDLAIKKYDKVCFLSPEAFFKPKKHSSQVSRLLVTLFRELSVVSIELPLKYLFLMIGCVI